MQWCVVPACLGCNRRLTYQNSFGFLVGYTVEPPKKGHFGNGTFVLSSEVVLISEVHEIF